MVKPIRRIVTGHDAEGRSILQEDGPAPNVFRPSHSPNVGLTNLWLTDTLPASTSDGADPTAQPFKLEPPAKGNVVRIVEFPPDKVWRKAADARKAFASIGAGGAPDHGSADAMMHATATVDYIIVLKGEIWAIMDKGEKLLKPGDVLIQRGTNHSWSVRTNEPCVIAAVLIGAKPAGRLARKKRR